MQSAGFSFIQIRHRWIFLFCKAGLYWFFYSLVIAEYSLRLFYILVSTEYSLRFFMFLYRRSIVFVFLYSFINEVLSSPFLYSFIRSLHRRTPTSVQPTLNQFKTNTQPLQTLRLDEFPNPHHYLSTKAHNRATCTAKQSKAPDLTNTQPI